MFLRFWLSPEKRPSWVFHFLHLLDSARLLHVCTLHLLLLVVVNMTTTLSPPLKLQILLFKLQNLVTYFMVLHRISISALHPARHCFLWFLVTTFEQRAVQTANFGNEPTVTFSDTTLSATKLLVVKSAVLVCLRHEGSCD